MVKTSDEKRWERMQQQLLAEARGDGPIRLSSNKTLFGIKSHAQEVIERTVAELEQEHLEQRNADGSKN